MEQTHVKEEDASTEYGTELQNKVRNLTQRFEDQLAQLVEKANLSSKNQIRCLQEQISALENKLQESETDNTKEIERIMKANVSIKQSEEDIRREYDVVLNQLSKETKANEELRLNLQLSNTKHEALLLDLQTKEKELESKSTQSEVLKKELSKFMASESGSRPHMHNAGHSDDASAEVALQLLQKKTEEVKNMELEIECLNRDLLASRTRERLAIAKSPEDMLKICEKNEGIFVYEMDLLQQEIAQKEGEIKKLNISLQSVQYVSNEDTNKLHRQLTHKRRTIIILKQQKELLQKRVSTAKATVNLLTQESAATSDVFSEPSPQLKQLIEKDVQLEQSYKKTQQDLHAHERCHDGTTTDEMSTETFLELNNEVNEFERNTASLALDTVQEVAKLTSTNMSISGNLVPAEDVDTSLFTNNGASGGSGESPFMFIKLDNGAALKRIKAWVVTYAIRGVEVWMTGGSSFFVGARDGDSKEFIFESGELITRLTIKASRLNGNGRLGALVFETDHNRKWEISSSSDHLVKDGGYRPEVGSGICWGIFGAAGADIDRLGFAMLRKTKQIYVLNVTYPYLTMHIAATKPETIAQGGFSNDTDRDQEVNLRGSKTVTVTR